MITRTSRCVAIACAALAGCTDTAPGDISRDAEPFAQVSEDATISALGTEPFWNLEIAPADDGYRATYSTPENIDGATIPVSRFAGNNGLGFSGELDGAGLQLALTPGECSDAMSDRTYPYTATILLGEDTLYGCAYTSDEPFAGDPSP
jgi:uncharacterized membrane protein